MRSFPSLLVPAMDMRKVVVAHVTECCAPALLLPQSHQDTVGLEGLTPGVQATSQCISHLHCVTNHHSLKVKVSKLLTQSCQTLCNAMDCSLPGSSIHKILQARILEWVAIPFSRGASRPRDRTQVSCTSGRFFTI